MFHACNTQVIRPFSIPSVWFFSSSVSMEFSYVFSTAYRRLSGIGSIVGQAKVTVDEID